MSASGAVDSEGVPRQDFTGGTDIGNIDLPTKKEWGASGYRTCGGGLEGMCSSGKFLDKADHGAPWCATWLQGGLGSGHGDLGSKFVTTVGRDIS